VRSIFAAKGRPADNPLIVHVTCPEDAEPLCHISPAARALMERMLADAADLGAAVMYLDVRESNEAARALYRVLGFEETGLRRNYYTKPRENAILMQKALAREIF